MYLLYDVLWYETSAAWRRGNLMKDSDLVIWVQVVVFGGFIYYINLRNEVPRGSFPSVCLFFCTLLHSKFKIFFLHCIFRRSFFLFSFLSTLSRWKYALFCDNESLKQWGRERYLRRRDSKKWIYSNNL